MPLIKSALTARERHRMDIINDIIKYAHNVIDVENSNPPKWWMPTPTKHSIFRYREHFCGAYPNDMLFDIANSKEIYLDKSIPIFIKNRNHTNEGLNVNKIIYLYPKHNRGIFVLATQNDISYNVVTYLRLTQYQTHVLNNYLYNNCRVYK